MIITANGRRQSPEEKKKKCCKLFVQLSLLGIHCKDCRTGASSADTSAVSTLTTIIVLSSGVKEGICCEISPPCKSQLNRTKPNFERIFRGMDAPEIRH